MPSCPQTDLEIVATKTIGKHITNLRKSQKMSQSELSNLIGVSYQQLQKYEKGINRISASKLHVTALALQVDVNKFFENIPS